MTPEEIETRIAEQVMKLRPGVDFGAWPEHDWIRDKSGEVDALAYCTDDHNGPQCARCHYCYCEHCQDGPDEPCKIEPDPYARDLGTAWQVVDALTDAGARVDVIQRKGGKTNCTVAVRGRDYHVAAETAPLAICQAALRAVGGEKP